MPSPVRHAMVSWGAQLSQRGGHVRFPSTKQNCLNLQRSAECIEGLLFLVLAHLACPELPAVLAGSFQSNNE